MSPQPHVQTHQNVLLQQHATAGNFDTVTLELNFTHTSNQGLQHPNAFRMSKEYEKSQLSKQQQLKSRTCRRELAAVLAQGVASDEQAQPAQQSLRKKHIYMKRAKPGASQQRMPASYASVIPSPAPTAPEALVQIHERLAEMHSTGTPENILTIN